MKTYSEAQKLDIILSKIRNTRCHVNVFLASKHVKLLYGQMEFNAIRNKLFTSKQDRPTVVA
jgi:hypothetical protein